MLEVCLSDRVPEPWVWSSSAEEDDNWKVCGPCLEQWREDSAHAAANRRVSSRSVRISAGSGQQALPGSLSTATTLINQPCRYGAALNPCRKKAACSQPCEMATNVTLLMEWLRIGSILLRLKHVRV